MNQIDSKSYLSGDQISQVYNRAIKLENLVQSSPRENMITYGRVFFSEGQYSLRNNGEGVNLKLPSEIGWTLSAGDLVFAEGNYRKGPAPTFEASRLTLCSKCKNDFDNIKDSNRFTGSSMVFDYERRKTLITRAKINKTIRDFLDNRGFVEVETPILQFYPDSAPVGTFSTVDLQVGHNYHLRICPEEFIKRLSFGIEKVYELGKCFRNEGKSKKHSPEFTMLEAYESFVSYRESMDLTERLIEGIVTAVNQSTRVEYGGTEIDFKTPWPRVSVREMAKKNYNLDIADRDVESKLRELLTCSDTSKRILFTKFIGEKIEPLFIQPTFLTDFPVEYVTHGKVKVDDNTVVEGAEAFIAKGLEIASVGAVNNDPNTLRAHNTQNIINKFGKERIVGNLDEDYLHELEFGMPPLSGFGIGIDRLIMVLLGRTHIDETQAYPFRAEK